MDETEEQGDALPFPAGLADVVAMGMRYYANPSAEAQLGFHQALVSLGLSDRALLAAHEAGPPGA